MEKIIWNIDNIIAFTTTRKGGVSKGTFNSLNCANYVGDNAEDVLTNNQLLAKNLNITTNQMVAPNQTHSINIKKVDHTHGGLGINNTSNLLDDTDAIYTSEKNLYIGVFHADCVPILIYSPDKQIVAAIHSGWKGTAKAIAYHSIQHLINHENCDPNQMLVYIGPSIAQEDMQGDSNILNQFIETNLDITDCYTKLKDDWYNYDLAKICENQILANNVPKKNITINTLKTSSNTDLFFSFNKEKNCGRHLSIIAIK